MAELMYKIANEEAPDIRIVRPQLSERMANIVALSMSKRPETRYQDGDQFAADLRSVMAELSGAPAAPATAPAFGGAPAGDAGSEKTAVFAVPPAGMAAEQADKTAVFSRPAAGGDTFEKTQVATASSPAPSPVYDATQKVNAADNDPFAKTVVARPSAPGQPPSGNGSNDLEI
jgi:serine/threonine-protein kinase